jgi:hypothetical protein
LPFRQLFFTAFFLQVLCWDQGFRKHLSEDACLRFSGLLYADLFVGPHFQCAYVYSVDSDTSVCSYVGSYLSTVNFHKRMAFEIFFEYPKWKEFSNPVFLFGRKSTNGHFNSYPWNVCTYVYNSSFCLLLFFVCFLFVFVCVRWNFDEA